MRLELDGPEVRVVLSKRNLLALLAKVDDPDSAKTIYSADALEGHLLWVSCEADILHYGMREFAPGEMHPKAETFIQEYGE